MFQKTLTFNDISIIPKYSDIETRKEINISNSLKNIYGLEIKLGIPIIASPMNTISGYEMANTLDQKGSLAIIHRFCSIDEQRDIIQKAKNKNTTNIGRSHWC